MKRHFLTERVAGIGTGCPGSMCSPHPWNYQRCVHATLQGRGLAVELECWVNGWTLVVQVGRSNPNGFMKRSGGTGAVISQLVENLTI